MINEVIVVENRVFVSSNFDYVYLTYTNTAFKPDLNGAYDS